MFLRIHIQSPGFNLQTVLQAEALPELIAFVQKHRVSDPEVLKRGRDARQTARSAKAGSGLIPANEAPVTLTADAIAVRAYIAAKPAEALLAGLRAATFPEKLLVATGWLQAHGPENAPPNRRDIKRLLVRLGHEPPANPGRDFRTAWTEGWLTQAGELCITVTNEGWAKIGLLTEDKE